MDPSRSTVHATPSFIWTIRRRSQLEKNHDQVLSAKYLVRSLVRKRTPGVHGGLPDVHRPAAARAGAGRLAGLDPHVAETVQLGCVLGLQLVDRPSQRRERVEGESAVFFPRS